ncbi:MAG: zinc-binding dehydrogenase [Actinomycetota bacterium]
MRARALTFVAPRLVDVEQVDVAAPKAGEVLVRTLYSGISPGTEMLAYRGEIDAAVPLDERIGALGGTFAFPFRYGYSCVGRVEDARGSLPLGSLVFAFHPHQDLLVIRESDLVPLPENEPRRATLFPSVETALQISLDVGPVQSELVVVLGLGVIGTLAAALLSRAGAEIVAVEPRPWRRAAAASFGIDPVTPDEAEDAVSRYSDGRGAALLVEASGAPDALAGGLRLLAHEGTALAASWYGNKVVALPLGGEFHRRRLTIRSTQVSTIPAHLSGRWSFERRRKVALRLMRELPLERLATHEFPFVDAAEAFDAIDRGSPGLVHAALRYDR